ncbi:MAG: nuclear transport factor 2 family protein [Gimesia sp.]
MKKKFVCLTAMAIFAVTLFCDQSINAEEQKKESVRVAVKEFYSALNQMFTGDLTKMKNVWSHKSDVTYMGPDGKFQHGWKKVLSDWEKQAALKLGGKVEPADLHIVVGPELAVVSNYEIGKNKGPQGQIRKVKIRATSLFRKENGKWKMIGHHTDLLPFLK